jgi:hypothetical protein
MVVLREVELQNYDFTTRSTQLATTSGSEGSTTKVNKDLWFISDVGTFMGLTRDWLVLSEIHSRQVADGQLQLLMDNQVYPFFLA